jgi:hypothetical protein
MSPETVTLEQVGESCWHVLKPVEEITASERANSWTTNPRLIGQIQKQEFTSYPKGKPVKRKLWFPRTKGGLPAGKPQKTRAAAIGIVCEAKPRRMPFNRAIKGKQ